MTEEEWMVSESPTEMVWFLGSKATNRKLQLFACACCRRIGHLLPSEESKVVLKTMEEFAEGKVTAEKMAGIRKIASEKWFGDVAKANQLAFVAVVEKGDSLCDMVEFAANATAWEKVGTPSAVSKPEERVQASLLRDIFGNPFQPISINPNWLTPTVTNLAIVAYEQRAMPSGELDTALLGILADALEDSGCHNQEILGHFRSPGVHVRGCFALDALLGKC